jgi:hypothetical protein
MLFNVEEIEKESFDPILKNLSNWVLICFQFFKVTNDIEAEIAEVANNGDYDLLLVGLGKSIF